MDESQNGHATQTILVESLPCVERRMVMAGHLLLRLLTPYDYY